MPPTCPVDGRFQNLLIAQDYVLSRDQAMGSGMTRRAIDHALARKGWQRLLPGVYLVAPTEPTRRQLLIAALLWAGDAAAIDDVDACRFHGIQVAIEDDEPVYVV